MVVSIFASTINKLVLTLIFFTTTAWGLSSDGILLFSFKYSILSDPLAVLKSWSFYDESPCTWNGVSCGSSGTESSGRVTGLSLPNSHLLGSMSLELVELPHLQVLNLANNFINGSLPSVFNSTELRFLDLSNNKMSGVFYNTVALPSLSNLQFLNLSNNALTGHLPSNISIVFPNLTVLSVANNYLFGDVPQISNKVKFVDLSYNLFNGSLPSNFSGAALSHLNISYNKLSGKIPPGFGRVIPRNATIDFSFNNLTGPVPETTAMLNQNSSSYIGNSGLCGKPTDTLCPTPSTASSSPNESSSPMSPPALAAIPRDIGLRPATSSPSPGKKRSKFRPSTVIGIIAGDAAGVILLAIVFYYIYRSRKTKKKANQNITITKINDASSVPIEDPELSLTSKESTRFMLWKCLRAGRNENQDSESTDTSENNDIDCQTCTPPANSTAASGTLVMLDGLKELELETLLKASAFILGTTGTSIMYKAVLDDGRVLAVRRIGESHVERFRDFENQVRSISKLIHPNLVQIRGFYWGADEKLIIYDFVPNGSLAHARHPKTGPSLNCPLSWEARFRIAKGVARGLAFLHEKRHVHGNLKPSNILLGSDSEPKIGDFGLERIEVGEISYKGGSTRIFGSKRSTASRDSLQDLCYGLGPSPSPSSVCCLSPYLAPESLRTLKPHAKWDVFSFGVILLELLTGKIVVVDEMGQASNGVTVEDGSRAVRMADLAIRAELEGKEESLLACFKLGYTCASPLPHKRPTMKEVSLALEKMP